MGGEGNNRTKRKRAKRGRDGGREKRGEGKREGIGRERRRG